MQSASGAYSRTNIFEPIEIDGDEITYETRGKYLSVVSKLRFNEHADRKSVQEEVTKRRRYLHPLLG